MKIGARGLDSGVEPDDEGVEGIAVLAASACRGSRVDMVRRGGGGEDEGGRCSDVWEI